MWNLKCGTSEPIYRTETDSQTWRASRLVVVKGGGGGSGTNGSLESADANSYIENGWAIMSYCIAQGTISSLF